MKDPVFAQMIPADGWLAEYRAGQGARTYERLIAFVCGRFPTGLRFPAEEWKHGIDGMDGQQRLAANLPGFVRFVRFEDLDEETQRSVRESARPPRPGNMQVGSPEWNAAMSYGVDTPAEEGATTHA